MSKEVIFAENDLVFSLHPEKAHENQIGTISLLAFNIEAHTDLLHSWLSLPYASYWGMTDKTAAEIFQHYKNVQTQNLCQTYLGFVNSEPAFFIEVYDPEVEGVTQYYDKQTGDCGIHILIAPAEKPIRGYTRQIFMAVMEFLFSQDAVARIVVEPDHRNTKIHAINRYAGFFHSRKIDMGHKQAYLAFCTRQQFENAKQCQRLIQSRQQRQQYFHKPTQLNRTQIMQYSPEAASTVTDEATWVKVNRLLVRKAIAEFSHERIFEPQPFATDSSSTDNSYLLAVPDSHIEYRFTAKKMQLNHWAVDVDSLQKTVDGQPSEIDALRFFLEFQQVLGIEQSMLPTYLEEITSTLCGSAYKHSKSGLSSEQLVDADFQAIEVAMNEGHPCFVANNGRIGFSSEEYRAYAPECGSPINLIWVAAHKRRAHFSCIDESSYRALLESEFDVSTRERFAAKLTEAGVNQEDYLYIPVHPWQWFNKLASIYAADIACKDLICLGYGDDHYLAQQSIRTFYNISQPGKAYVKTALSILNMGFVRGLSSYYMRTTPAINAWLHQLVEQDSYLKSLDFSVLREFAAVGYSNPYYENAQVGDSPYKKMLAALWRENPSQYLQPNQRLATMASLLHVDTDGKALLPALIRRSGLSVEAWLDAYLKVYLKPLLHCFYAHNVVFMPHGENLILGIENHVPVRAFMKDIGEEIAILNSDIVLPEDVARISVKIPPEDEKLSLLTDIFDCFFRFMAAILEEQADYKEEQFWQRVAETIIDYQQAHPEFAERYKEQDLFTDEFILSCLNRLQLKNNQQMVNLADPSSSLQFAGTLVNPIARFRPEQQVDAKTGEAKLAAGVF